MTFNRKLRPLGALLLVPAVSLLVGDFAEAPSAARAPVPPPRARPVRSYRFKARVEKNGGVTPFKVGAVITGTFAYDPKVKKPTRGDASYAHYDSKLNAIEFRLGELRFAGAGEVMFTISRFEHAEHVGIIAYDLALPKGWSMDHTRRSQSYGLTLQNAPPKKAVAGVGVPGRIKLADFETTREVRLDFFHGVRFPGGRVDGRATVHAKVESLEEALR